MAILYTASVRSIGGRVGNIKSSDGVLDSLVSKPLEMGGTGDAPNPEMLFAAAYGACFGGSLKVVAQKQGIELVEGWSVEASVSLHQEGASVFLSAKLKVLAPGMEKSKIESVARTAHIVCPYSKALKGNIETEIMVEV
ncbi:MAG: Ohr family peroxiredoxin [Runella sp.]